MATWTLVPCLVSLRNEFNQLAPGRDKRSDGSIADAAHVAGGTSDHIGDEQTAALRGKDADKVNEVHAIDVDVDLKKAGWSMSRCVQIIVTRHRDGRDNRLQYVIWNRTIWSASWGWTGRVYTGASPHTEHAHFSARYDTARENDSRPWGLLEVAKPTESNAGSPKPGTRILRQGMSGADVGLVQRWTGADDDQKFGPATKDRVVRWQKIVGLPANGVVDGDDWTTILGRTIKL